MRIEKTDIEGLLIIEPRVLSDQRGYFFESYHEERLAAAGIRQHFVQDNQSRSDYGVIRGLHFQRAPYAQTKLVRVVQGSIFDVALDLRKDSPTFGKWFGLELSAENFRQLLIPKGFAHGFSVLSETAVVYYKCDSYYNRDAEGGIRFDDPDLRINWQIPEKNRIISDKDNLLPLFKKSVL